MMKLRAQSLKLIQLSLFVLLGFLLTLPLKVVSIQAQGTSTRTWQEDDKYEVVIIELIKGLRDRTPALEFVSLKALDLQETLPVLEDEIKHDHKFNAYLLLAMNALFHPGERFANAEDQYREFLNNLRGALGTVYYQSNQHLPANGLSEFSQIPQLRQVMLAIYNDVNITAFGSDLVGKVASKGKLKDKDKDKDKGFAPFTAITSSAYVATPPLSGQSLNVERLQKLEKAIAQLSETYEKIASAPSSLKASLKDKFWSSLRGHVGVLKFDPHSEGSLISKKMALTASASSSRAPLICIRTPSATIGSKEDVAEVAPEFLAYLAALSDLGLKHVYINLQDNRPPKGLKSFGIANEAPRSTCLQELNDHPLYGKAITVITLSKNSDFYHQKGEEFETEGEISAATFIMQFENELFDKKDSGFYFPASWSSDTSEQRSRIKEILIHIFALYFPEKKTLSHADRQNFIEYAYMLIGQFVAKDAHSRNYSCKDAIDRAGGAHALDFAILLALQAENPEMTDEQFAQYLSALPGIVFTDALMAKQREIIHERLERFQQATLHLIQQLKKYPDLAQEIKNILPFTKVLIAPLKEQKVSDPRL